MTLATVLRYSDSGKGTVWDKSYMIGHSYAMLGEKFGVGVMAVISEAAIEDAVRMSDKCKEKRNTKAETDFCL